MRYRISALVVAAALAAVGYQGASQSSPVKLAYIDSNEVVALAPGAAEAQATFEREMARWRTEVQTLADSLQAMITAYEQQQVMLSPDARQQRQEEIQRKRLEFQQKTVDLDQVAQRRQQELVAPIYERVTNVLMELREENGYSMIFDAAAPSLVAADTLLDITDLVIARLQAAEGATEGTGN